MMNDPDVFMRCQEPLGPPLSRAGGGARWRRHRRKGTKAAAGASGPRDAAMRGVLLSSGGGCLDPQNDKDEHGIERGHRPFVPMPVPSGEPAAELVRVSGWAGAGFFSRAAQVDRPGPRCCTCRSPELRPAQARRPWGAPAARVLRDGSPANRRLRSWGARCSAYGADHGQTPSPGPAGWARPGSCISVPLLDAHRGSRGAPGHPARFKRISVRS